MPTKVTLKISKGKRSGEKFSYDQKETLILGRGNDCHIVLPEDTISRYHCLLDVALPSVVVRDFGSLNGTYLNEEKIGQRDAGMSIEEAHKQKYNKFPMKTGDCLRLGPDCEIMLEIHIPQYCAECLCEIEQPEHVNKDNLPICPACYAKARELKAKRSARSCEVCGAPLDGRLNTCSACLKDPVKILEFMLVEAAKGNEEVKGMAGYRKIKELGHGGMGVVWLVEERKTGKQMALKLMLPEAAANEQSRQMFLREAYMAGQLDHKNVVRQFKCGQSGDTYFILMEFCPGGSVDHLMNKQGGRLDSDLATHIILQVLDGLNYTHNKYVVSTLADGSTKTVKGIVHRDFKPANIFLSDNSSHPIAKVADFGLAKAFETAGLSGNTRSGQVAGTLPFMPRKQILNYRYVKHDVDVWAAAASYYNMLTGAYPKDFSEKDPYVAALKEDSTPISRYRPKISERLAEVIDRALIEKPDIGFQTAKEFKTAIEKAL